MRCSLDGLADGELIIEPHSAGVAVDNMIVLENLLRKPAGLEASLHNRNIIRKRKGDRFLTTFGLRYILDQWLEGRG